MRQVFLKKGSVVVKDVCQPLLDDYSVLVEVQYSFISSGTEVATIANAQQSMLLKSIPEKIQKVLGSISAHGLRGTAALVKSKLQGELQTLGYSCAGKVIAVGKEIRQLQVGDYVACAGAGVANHADIVVVPEHLIAKVHDKAFLKHASLTTIGAIALQGVRRSQPQLGETICVVGLGLLGQITVQLLKQSGCRVIGIDLLPERLDRAKKLGADIVYHAKNDDVNKAIDFLTHHHGVDTTIITAASSSDAIVQQAMEITRKKGKVVLVGDVGLGLQRSPLYQKEIDFLISCSYGPGRYDNDYERYGKDYPYAYVRWTEQRNMQAFVDLIERHHIDVDALISHEYDLESIDDAYKAVQSKDSLGVVLNYESGKQEEQDLVASHDTQKASGAITFIPAKKDSIRLGVIGAGGFAKVKLMPLIARMNNVSINAIADADIANSINVSKTYGAAKACVADKEMLSEDLVDAVLIASPHKFHCDQAINALRKGKAVFLEKPMVTNFDQLERMRSFLDANPDVPFCVDYNRSFAPFIQKIKKEIEGRTTPLLVHYRMNAGFISKDHWVQTELGAGRIIGEACHIFDLFCYLTDARPIAVSVEALHAQRDDLFPTDNFSAQVSFDDGSVCSLMYTALGHKQLGKERMEVFYDSKSIVMDDYARLTGYGLSSDFDEVMHAPDKGHENLLNQFFAGLHNGAQRSPISRERLDRVAQLTLVIDQLACKGGGTQELSL